MFETDTRRPPSPGRSRDRARVCPALALVAVALVVCGCSALGGPGGGAATRPAPDPVRWAALAGSMAAPWPALQERDGRFRDYLAGADAGFPERYGEAVLGYGLLQSGVRDGSPRAVRAGLRALDWVVAPGGGSPRTSPFENLAVAAAYNLATRRLAGDQRFARSRPRWEAWLRSARLTRLPDTSYYGNKHLVDAVAALELLRTGVRSRDPGAVLGGARARARRLAVELVNERIPALERAGSTVVAGRPAFVLSDPPTNPLAYHGLSVGMYARAVRLLGEAASARARDTLRAVAHASWALAAPDGGVAYFGRSQEQAWALSLTAYGAEAAARLAASDAAEDARYRAVAERALARLRDVYGSGAEGLRIVPALSQDPSRGRRALDRYAFATGYAGLTLMALNWSVEEMAGQERRLGGLAADADGAAHVLARQESAFATVRQGELWYAVKGAPEERLGDLRYGFGLAAAQVRSGHSWRAVMPLLPKTRGGVDSPGPLLSTGGGEAALPFAERVATTPGGGVTMTGGFRTRDAAVRLGVTFRYEPRPCGVRVLFPARAGDRIEYSVFFRGSQLPVARDNRLLADDGQTAEWMPAARLRLEPGYSSASDAEVVRARLEFRPRDDTSISVTICRDQSARR